MGSLLVGVVMVVGVFGVVIPLLPGTALILAAGVAWALLVVEQGSGRWVVIAIMAALFLVGIALKYALPGKRLSGQLTRTTLLYGGVAAVVGFFLLPPFGLLIGGVAGVYVAEARRHGNGPEARRSTVQVLKAVGLGILAELTAAVLMVGTWLVGLALT